MIDKIFTLCVVLLHWIARLCGTTYEAVNVVIFCLLWPLVTVGLIVLVIWQRWEIQRLLTR